MKNMPYKNTLSLLLFLFCFSLNAQNGRFSERKDQIKALKVAFITNELNLTSEEAEKFWPVYNTYDDKQTEIRVQKMRTYTKKLSDGSLETMSDKEALQFLNQIENADEEQYLLKKKLNIALRSIISPIKILKLRRSEIAFDRKLLQQYRNNRK